MIKRLLAGLGLVAALAACTPGASPTTSPVDIATPSADTSPDMGGASPSMGAESPSSGMESPSPS